MSDVLLCPGSTPACQSGLTRSPAPSCAPTPRQCLLFPFKKETVFLQRMAQGWDLGDPLSPQLERG